MFLLQFICSALTTTLHGVSLDYFKLIYTKAVMLRVNAINMTRESNSIGDLRFTVGQIFENRKELSDSGIHRPTQAGIWNGGGDFAVSIVVSGGYIDDTESGRDLLYTGQGGRDDTGRHVSDQELTRGNLGLFNSMKSNIPVRVTRGYQIESGPDKGYRYDGLYMVKRAYIEPSDDGPLIWRFELTPVIEATEMLLWQKKLTQTDAQKQKGNPTGNLRLTQAGFRMRGELIDQTQYFRYELWGSEDWHSIEGSSREYCEVKFDVYIYQEFKGTTFIEISHNPEWESSQSNFTTGIRWGPWLSHLLLNEINCTGLTLSIIKKDGFTLEIN